jgi:hypothetical protein
MINELHVRVKKFQGKNGGFATQLSTMYEAQLVNAKGEVKSIELDPSTARKYSDAIAKRWAEFLDCQIVDVEELEVRTSTTQIVYPETELEPQPGSSICRSFRCNKHFKHYQYDGETETERCFSCVNDEEIQAAIDGLMGG